MPTALSIYNMQIVQIQFLHLTNNLKAEKM